jgi:hypothetical protein
MSKEVVLKKFDFKGDYLIDWGDQFIDDLEGRLMIDKAAKRYVVELESRLYGQSDKKIIEVYHSMPSSFWQMFKEQYFPKWLKKISPVKKVNYKILVEVEFSEVIKGLPRAQNEHLSFMYLMDSVVLKNGYGSFFIDQKL